MVCLVIGCNLFINDVVGFTYFTTKGDCISLRASRSRITVTLLATLMATSSLPRWPYNHKSVRVDLA